MSDGFRLNCKHLFLTYPQCPITPSDALSAISTKGLDFVDHIIAQEAHKDGSLHLHIYLRARTKFNLRNAKLLDIQEYHGNYQSCRSPRAVMKYVTKEGNYVTNMDLSDLSSTKEHYQTARTLAMSEGVKSAMTHLAKTDRGARDLILYGTSIRKNLVTLTKRTSPPTYPLESFNLDWTWDKTKLLILWGETNCGKTSLAKALLPNALMLGHLDKLALYQDGDYEGIVFDDMSFSHLPRETQIYLTDTAEYRDIHIRYTVVTIPSGTPKIVTTNLVPDSILRIDRPEIRRRVQLCEVLENFVYKFEE